MSKLPYPSSAACVVTVGTKVYIAGGLKNGTITNRTIMYDTEIDEWIELESMSTPRFAPGCVYNDGMIYVFGGQTSGEHTAFGPDLNSTEIYTISTNQWMESDAQLSNNSHWITAVYMNIASRNLQLWVDPLVIRSRFVIIWMF